MTYPLTLLANNPHFEMLKKGINEMQRVQTIILNSFQGENLPQEELQLKRQIVLEKPPMDWPLLPLSKGIFAEEIIKYINHIHSKCCLDSKSNLWQLWVLDI